MVLSNPYFFLSTRVRGGPGGGDGLGGRYMVVCFPANIVLEEALDTLGAGEAWRKVNRLHIG